MQGERQEQRARLRLPVRVWGMDHEGKLFDVKAHTVDITPIGARLEGVTCLQEPGTIVGVECGRSRSRFRVMWIGSPGTRHEGQIGIRCVEPGKYIWGVALARVMGDADYRPTESLQLPRRAVTPGGLRSEKKPEARA